MTKGIYIQLLSRHIKKSENSVKRSTSSNSNNTNLSKFADNILTAAFYKFKAGDEKAARASIRKLSKLTGKGGKYHFACHLCLSIGLIRLKRYEETIQILSEVINMCGHKVFALCDSLIILSEAYAAIG